MVWMYSLAAQVGAEFAVLEADIRHKDQVADRTELERLVEVDILVEYRCSTRVRIDLGALELMQERKVLVELALALRRQVHIDLVLRFSLD